MSVLIDFMFLKMDLIFMLKAKYVFPPCQCSKFSYVVSLAFIYLEFYPLCSV